MAEPARRGRPKLADDEARRAAFTFRAPNELKQKLTKAAEQSGRSIAQEIEMRLEMSFAREADGGSASASTLADLIRLVASRLEATSGKIWTEDYATYLAVELAIRRILWLNAPKEAVKFDEIDDKYAAEMARVDELKAELEAYKDAATREADPVGYTRLLKRLSDLQHLGGLFNAEMQKRSAMLGAAYPQIKGAMDPLIGVFKIKR